MKKVIKPINNIKTLSENSKKETPKLQVSSQIKNLMNSINKRYGDNAVMLGSSLQEDIIERIPTGSVFLDIDLGGGIPIGRYTQISGAYSSTKTTQVLHIIRNAQEMGITCALIDVEGTTDKKYLKRLGVNTENLVYCRPEGLEEATNIMIDLQKSGEVGLIVWDSIEASTPTKERDSDMEDTVQMGIKPKLLGEYFRKFQAHNNRLVREGKQACTLIAINQLREKIGNNYGNPEYTPGGRAKDFTASVDLRFRRGDWIAEGTGENKVIVGQVVKYKIEKNKTYVRMRSGEFDFYFDDNEAGIQKSYNDNIKSIIMLAIQWGLIEKGGAWFYLDPERTQKFNGLKSLVDHIKEHPELIDTYKEHILKIEKENLNA